MSLKFVVVKRRNDPLNKVLNAPTTVRRSLSLSLSLMSLSTLHTSMPAIAIATATAFSFSDMFSEGFLGDVNINKPENYWSFLNTDADELI